MPPIDRATLLLAVAVVTIGLTGCVSTPDATDDRIDPVAVSDRASPDGSLPSPVRMATPGPAEAMQASGSGGTASGSTFTIEATTNDDLDYRFTVEGDVTKTTAADGTAADADDRITENGDGTSTVAGSTGDRAGDAYLVDGRIVSFEKTGGESLYRLFLDGEEVTEELTPGSTFEVVSTDDDAELGFRFTVDGDVRRMVSEDGHAGDRSDEIVGNDDGTTAVRGSTGFGSGDAFAVEGTVTSFERTGGDSSFVLYLDGEDVTDDLSAAGGDGGSGSGDGGTDAGGSAGGESTDAGGGDGGAAGGDAGGGSASDGEGGSARDDSVSAGDGEVYGDSTYDVSHTRSIRSNGDGTTTVSGAVWNRVDGSTENLVMVVEAYDDRGDWLDSAWVELDPVTPERQSYSLAVDVPRDAVDEVRTDVNTNTGAGPGDHPGRCHEIDGDGPDDQKLEDGPVDVIHTDSRTVLVGEVFNGKGRTVGLAHVTFALRDEDGDRVGTETLLLEDLPAGERREFATVVDRDGVAGAAVDVDEVAINYRGELVCRPPL